MNFRLVSLSILIILIFSCKKEDPETPSVQDVYENGLLVLNEGLFQQNNASLSWINLETGVTTEQVFLSINNRPLGDTGNDMAIYGGKLYIIVNASSTIEVLNAETLKSIKQIQLQNNGQGQQPRQIKFHNGNAYITSFDGYVNVLDTASLSITDQIMVGQNPEGLAISNNSLYVSNSGGLSYPDVDSTVFRIDLTSHSVTDTFVVGNNPGDVICDNQGDVYVVKRGDYSQNDPSELVRISNNSVVTNLGIAASFLSKHAEKMCISYYDYNNGNGNVSLFDMMTETIVDHDLLSGEQPQTLYGSIQTEDHLFVQDAMNFTNSGFVLQYNSTGSFQSSYTVGLNPTKIIYYD